MSPDNVVPLNVHGPILSTRFRLSFRLIFYPPSFACPVSPGNHHAAISHLRFTLPSARSRRPHPGRKGLEEAIAKVDQGATGCGQQITKNRDLKRAALKNADVKAEFDALDPEFELARQIH